MTSLSHPRGLSSRWPMIEAFFSSLFCRLHWPTRSRRLHRRDDARAFRHHDQQHFGSLDDQLLNDLGLQRSKIRAAEYGILPGDQALHHENDVQPDGDRSKPPPPPQT